MISPKTVQVTKYCGLFLIFLIFLSVDLAFTLTISLYLALNSKTYTKLLVVSLGLFVADTLLKHFDISIRFISDLLLDSYILLLTCLFIFIRLQEKILIFFQRVRGSGRNLISLHILEMIVVSSLLSLLLAPIVGIPYAVISGYISFSYFSKHFDGKYAYIAGLLFLVFCPFFIIAKRDSLSENFAIISFYFLIIGTIQEIVRQMQKHKEEPGNKRIETVSKDELVDIISGYKSFSSSSPEINFGSKIWQYIFIAGITAIISFIVIYFGIRNNLSLKSLTTMITSKSQKISPTISISPAMTSIILNPTVDVGKELSTASAELKLLVENGTEIYGLAASTAARLKSAGFKNVDTGNAARSDYKNWEISSKKDDPFLINYIKKIFKLEALTENKASESAKFDLLIIAGSKLP